MVRTLLFGTVIWGVGAFTATWIWGLMAWVIDYVLGGFRELGFSPLEAFIHFVPLFIQNTILIIPFLFSFELLWGVLRYWYIGGIASALYLWICTGRGKSLPVLLGLLIVLQIVAFIVLGSPIKYRTLELYESMWLYYIPIIAGSLLVYWYDKRHR